MFKLKNNYNTFVTYVYKGRIIYNHYYDCYDNINGDFIITFIYNNISEVHINSGIKIYKLIRYK